MKKQNIERAKTVTIIILLITLLILIIECRINRACVILPGHRPGINSGVDREYYRFSDQFEDRMFHEKYELTR